MSNLNRRSLFFLLIFVLHFVNVSSQEYFQTGDIVHESTEFPLWPVVSTQFENAEDPSYFQVEFNSEDVLNYFYESIDTDPPNYDTQMRYFWTFGDGHISYESAPIHQYAVGGSYQVTLQATPIYSPKPPPPLMKVNIPVPFGIDGVLDVSASVDSFSWNAGRFYLTAEMLRNFRSNFESSMIITYKNDSELTVNDAIQVYYDSQKVDAVAVYSFQGEEAEFVGDIVTNSEMVPELSTDDHQMFTIPFTNLGPHETRRLLVQFVSNNSSATFDPEIYFGVNFQNNYLAVVPLIQSSLRKSWDPNAKEAFVDYISPLDIPNSVKYRIYMENIGSAPTHEISVLDRVHSVLNIDSYTHAIVRSKDDEISWTYEPYFEDDYVNNFTSNIFLAGQTPGSNIEDSKFWFDVEYELDNPRLQEKIEISNGYCRNGLYKFGRNAKITFDDNPPINTNTPLIAVGCPKEEIAHCIMIKQIFPNPVNNSGTLVYEIDAALQKPIDVYAVSKFGNKIRIASNLSAKKGVHSYDLDFSGLPSDIYRLIVGNKDCSAKIEGFIKK